MVVAIRPLIMSKHEGTVLVISIVCTPASMAVRHAWKPASASSVRSTPHRRLGKTSAIDLMDRLRLVEGGCRTHYHARGDGGRAARAAAPLVCGGGSRVLERDVSSRGRTHLPQFSALGVVRG